MPVNIVMLGPQKGHAEDDVKKEVGNEIPVTVINMMDYGMMNGANVLKTALDMI
ncbi:PTS system N,N'-diacetylchitobiose-specific transporter subunit IIB [compost metagenome]